MEDSAGLKTMLILLTQECGEGCGWLVVVCNQARGGLVGEPGELIG